MKQRTTRKVRSLMLVAIVVFLLSALIPAEAAAPCVSEHLVEMELSARGCEENAELSQNCPRTVDGGIDCGGACGGCYGF